eukprot:7123416-Prymnesium_polylepis.1
MTTGTVPAGCASAASVTAAISASAVGASRSSASTSTASASTAPLWSSHASSATNPGVVSRADSLSDASPPRSVVASAGCACMSAARVSAPSRPMLALPRTLSRVPHPAPPSTSPSAAQLPSPRLLSERSSSCTGTRQSFRGVRSVVQLSSLNALPPSRSTSRAQSPCSPCASACASTSDNLHLLRSRLRRLGLVRKASASAAQPVLKMSGFPAMSSSVTLRFVHSAPARSQSSVVSSEGSVECYPNHSCMHAV